MIRKSSGFTQNEKGRRGAGAGLLEGAGDSGAFSGLAFLVLAIGLNAFTTASSPIAPKIWPSGRRSCPGLKP